MSLQTFAPIITHATSLEGIAKALGISAPLFREVVECNDPGKLYRQHRIPKRAPRRRESEFVEIDGLSVHRIGWRAEDFRYVWESINPALKLAHKSAAFYLGRFLENAIPGFPHVNAYGYIRGRSTRDHAGRHKGACCIVSADIKNFFPSITMGRVDAGLRNAGISKDVASLLAKFLTIEGRLPQGLNASPLIANYLIMPLDVQFSDLAKDRNLVYTRYADDLTFSGRDNLPSPEDIQSILASYGFEINQRKYRRSKRGQKHYVTGLSVADPDAPHAPKHIKKRLRQELFFIKKLGLNNHLATLRGSPTRQHAANRLEGMISYVTSVEPALAKTLWPLWKDICAREVIRKSFSPRPFINLRNSSWYVDEAEFGPFDGQKFLAVACVEVYNIDVAESVVRNFALKEAEDPYINPGSAKNLNMGSVHWNELTMNQRSRLVDVLSGLNFQCRVAICRLEPVSKYEWIYSQLLSLVFDSMLRSADDADVEATVEANSAKVSNTCIQKIIRSTFDKLVGQNERRPTRPPAVSIVGKGVSPLVGIADGLLGVLHGYLLFDDKKPTEQFLFYKRLESRFQLVLDLVTEQVSHRKNPLQPWGGLKLPGSDSASE